MPKQKQPLLAALAFRLDQAEPSRIQIFPAGRFDAPGGAMLGAGPWTLDQAAATALIQRVQQRENDMPVYYEHADLNAAATGGKAIASGWLDRASLQWVEGSGLYGTVAWTAAARAHIDAGEYRFLSPLFSYDETTGTPLNLFSIGLTNNPAIDGMQELLAAASAALHFPQDKPMDDLIDQLKAALLSLLNLPVTSTPQDLLAALDQVKAMIAQDAAEDAAEMPAAATSGLTAFMTARKQQIAALRLRKPNPAEFVPIAALSSTQNELAALKAKLNEREVADLINPALADGRLLEGQKAWALDLGKTNLAALSGYLATAKPIPALAGMQTKGIAPQGISVGEGDGVAIAAAATKYQAEQLAAGIKVSDIDAVLHVKNQTGA